MIQSLLNISPYYDKLKEENLNLAKNFLFFLILIVLVLSFLFDLLLNGFNSILADIKSYIYLLIIPYFVYSIISSRLTLNKGEFVLLGKNKTSSFKKEILEIINEFKIHS